MKYDVELIKSAFYEFMDEYYDDYEKDTEITSIISYEPHEYLHDMYSIELTYNRTYMKDPIIPMRPEESLSTGHYRFTPEKYARLVRTQKLKELDI